MDSNSIHGGPAADPSGGVPPGGASSPAEELARRSAEAFAAASGVGSEVLRPIHPEDDMLRFGRDLGLEPERGLALYLRGGLEAARALEHVSGALGAPLAERRRILEFACGYGRVTRLLARATAPGALVASDVLEGALPFVKEHFGVEVRASHADPSALSLGGPYELILVASLFSHLSAERSEAFLARLLEALDGNGALVLTTHGAAVAPGHVEFADGFGFLAASESKVLSGEEYGTAYVSPERFRRLARAVGAGSARVFERAMWDLQDLWVLGPRPDDPRIEGLGPPPFPSGSLERAVLRNGRIQVGGWVRSPEEAGPPGRVVLLLGDAGSALGPYEAELGPPSLLPASRSGNRGRWHREWYIGGPPPAGAAGVLPVVALAEVAGRAAVPFDVRSLDLGRPAEDSPDPGGGSGAGA